VSAAQDEGGRARIKDRHRGCCKPEHAGCSGIRTINGYDTATSKSFCEIQIATCVILAAGVIGAGVGIAVSASGHHRNPNDAAAVLAILNSASTARSGSTVSTTAISTANQNVPSNASTASQ
jgi:hypothetical protein